MWVASGFLASWEPPYLLLGLVEARERLGKALSPEGLWRAPAA